MMRHVWMALPTVLCLLPAQSPRAAEPPAVDVTNFGTFSARRITTEPDPQAPNLARAHSEGYTFLETTRDICARIGVNFGFELRRQAPPADPAWALNVTVDHPPILGMDGRIHVAEHERTQLRDGPRVLGWSYAHTNALVAGEWTWTVTVQGVVVTQQTFHVHTDCSSPMT